MVWIVLGFILLLPFAVHRWGADSRDFTDPRVSEEIAAMSGLAGPSGSSHRSPGPPSRGSVQTEIHATVMAMQAMNRPVAPIA